MESKSISRHLPRKLGRSLIIMPLRVVVESTIVSRLILPTNHAKEREYYSTATRLVQALSQKLTCLLAAFSRRLQFRLEERGRFECGRLERLACRFQ